MATVVIAGTVAVRPERREEAIRAARAMVEATRAEPGCSAYRFSIDLVDPNTVHIFEEWESEDALARHFATPHMARFQEVLPTVLAGAVTLRRYVVASAGAM
jgi:quinol monooxygenase YgiN